MTSDPTDWRRCFRLASEAFVRRVANISQSQLEQPGLGVWNIRDLVGHASRAMLTIEMYLESLGDDAAITGPIDYFVRALGTDNADAIADRGRESGAQLGADPATAVRDLAQRVNALVDSTPDDVVLARPPISFGAYLPTRVFELTVHTLDLSVALGASPPAELAEPIAACLDIAARIAQHTGNGAALLLAVTGRQPLPSGFSVV